jgi:hypothetical protein
MSERSDLIAEANDLGLDFKGNISNIKLQELVSEFKGEPIPVSEPAPPGPAVKAEAVQDLDDEYEVEDVPSAPRRMTAKEHTAILFANKRRKIAAAKKVAMKTSIVTLTNKDNRENDIMTTAFLSFENQYFGLAKNVPLDIPVQLEDSLIDIAEKCTMTLHKDEIIGGRRTGNKVPMTVKKYAVSYSRQIQE